MGQEKDNRSLGFLNVILLIYIFSTQIMALYFWVQYIKQDNIIMALLIDPIIAEVKGILWPFFI